MLAGSLLFWRKSFNHLPPSSPLTTLFSLRFIRSTNDNPVRIDIDWNKTKNPLNQRFRGLSDLEKSRFVRPPGLEPGTKRL